MATRTTAERRKPPNGDTHGVTPYRAACAAALVRPEGANGHLAVGAKPTAAGHRPNQSPDGATVDFRPFRANADDTPLSGG